MAGPSKSTPLETFLTGVSGQAASEQSDTPETGLRPARRVVVLTILSQAGAGAAFPDDMLRERSELASGAYHETIDDLLGKGLVARTDAGYVITEAGRALAERERARLLSLG